MNKKELVNEMAVITGFTKKNSEVALNAIVTAIGEAMASGEKVSLSGFGTFEVKDRASRNGVNPRTKEAIVIPATKRPTFSASKILKDAIKA